MSLDVQIKTIIISFIFGIYFNFFINLNYKIIYHKNKIFKIIGTFILVFLNTLFYFYLMMKVNNGYFHVYELLCIMVGGLVYRYLIENALKKWYNHKR